MNFVGKWGLYPWFEEHGIHHVHPDDLEAFRNLMPYGKVFSCEAANQFLLLRYRDKLYRVIPKLFKPIEVPAYNFNDRVIVVADGEEAIIDEITWHHERGEPMFFLMKDGKRRKKRYWANELRRVD